MTVWLFKGSISSLLYAVLVKNEKYFEVHGFIKYSFVRLQLMLLCSNKPELITQGIGDTAVRN